MESTPPTKPQHGKLHLADAVLSAVPSLMHSYHPFPQKADSALASTHLVHKPPTSQTQSSAYRLAWADEPFLLRDDLRPLRLQLEYTKPEKVLAEEGVDSTIVVFGSARIRDRETAEANFQKVQEEVKQNPNWEADRNLKERVRVAKKMMDSVKYYEAAREFGKIITEHSDGNKLWVSSCSTSLLESGPHLCSHHVELLSLVADLELWKQPTVEQATYPTADPSA